LLCVLIVAESIIYDVVWYCKIVVCRHLELLDSYVRPACNAVEARVCTAVWKVIQLQPGRVTVESDIVKAYWTSQ